MNRTLKLTFKGGTTKILDNIEEYVSGIKYFFLVFHSKIQKNQSAAFNRSEIVSIKRMTLDGSWKDVKLKKDKKGMKGDNDGICDCES